jgi:hypothetical protein
MIKKFITLMAVLVAVCAIVPGAMAGGTVTYKGQGFTNDGTTWNLNDQRCGAEGEGLANDGSTGQFANWNGPGQPYQAGQPYLVWVLTANGATSATLFLPGQPGVAMFQVGGTFKYASQYFSPEDLIGVAYATYTGTARGSVQLVVSHGCPAFVQGAWCSPGFWKNAEDGAWTLIGANKLSLFNDTVVPDFYDTASGLNPTIIDVLTFQGPGGANHFGAASAPFGLNAFNATGAYLTNLIPGFQFDPDTISLGDDTSCPIDHHGNFKTQQ